MNLPINRLLHVDGVSGLEALPPASIPLTVTSPPFDEIFRYGGQAWGESVWRAVIRQFWRVTAPGGVVCWQVRGQIRDGDISDAPERQITAFRRCGFKRYEDIQAASSRGRLYPRHHYRTVTPVYVFTKGRPATVDLRRTPNRYAGQRSGAINFREKDGVFTHRRPGVITAEIGVKDDVWYYPTGFNKTTTDEYAFEHEAMMPEELARDLILTFSRPGEIVLDPFGGAGTTAKMALFTHRRYISMEIEGRYHRIAVRRLREAHDRYRRDLDAWLGVG